MNDDLLYRPDALPGPLVPYRCGLPCWHQLQEEPGAGTRLDFSSTTRTQDVRVSETVTA
jgi:hypothetical protein